VEQLYDNLQVASKPLESLDVVEIR
jgi:hypothetical protein